MLRLIDGGVFGEYRGDNYEENPLKWYKNIEQLLRLDEMKCLGGEEELSNMLMGHFSVFGRSDCRPQATNLYRWGWESWRLAVGNEIAQIYPNAVDIMNIAAQNNGRRCAQWKLSALNLICGYFDQVFKTWVKYGAKKSICHI